MMSKFMEHYRGYFAGALRWNQLDALWKSVCRQPEGWYVYLINDEVPEKPIEAPALRRFINEVDALLRREHDYDYCGIVYTDSWESPQMIKIFDPNNLGASCGSAGYEIFPRWLLTRIKPEHLADSMPLPNNRRRWWQRMFTN